MSADVMVGMADFRGLREYAGVSAGVSKRSGLALRKCPVSGAFAAGVAVFMTPAGGLITPRFPGLSAAGVSKVRLKVSDQGPPPAVGCTEVCLPLQTDGDS